MQCVKVMITHNDIESQLDLSPENWGLRRHYASWLSDMGNVPLARVQLWLAKNQKCPGPKCVLEGAWHEATWFIESHAGTKWLFDYDNHSEIRPEWCLPTKVFNATKGHLVACRRDKGHHNRFARSWNGRRDAEAALMIFASEKKKKKVIEMRSLDALWDQDDELKPLFE